MEEEGGRGWGGGWDRGNGRVRETGEWSNFLPSYERGISDSRTRRWHAGWGEPEGSKARVGEHRKRSMRLLPEPFSWEKVVSPASSPGRRPFRMSRPWVLQMFMRSLPFGLGQFGRVGSRVDLSLTRRAREASGISRRGPSGPHSARSQSGRSSREPVRALRSPAIRMSPRAEKRLMYALSVSK